MHRRTEKGQSTLEYVIILSAIVGLILYAAVNMVKPRIDQAYKDVNGSIGRAAAKVAN